MSLLHQKAERFRALHSQGDGFIMPNPWDKGSAMMMAAAGFQALGTTSAGLAFSLGIQDKELTATQVLQNAQEICSVVDIPVSVDLEDGFGDIHEIAHSLTAAIAAGAVGGSIEDMSGDIDSPIRGFSESVERVEAAVAAARNLPIAFTLTARAENFLYGIKDLDDTIARLKAYHKAGADVLYAPALPDAESIKAVCRAIDAPVNVLLGAGNRLSVNELFALGVTRISIGSGLFRATLGTLLRDLDGLKNVGSCDFLTQAVAYPELERLIADTRTQHQPNP